MAILAAVYHLTHYKYDRPVVLGPQVIRLQPAPHSRTKVLSHSLKVLPENHFVNVQQDPYGNFLARFVFPEPVNELKIEVDLVADMTVYNPFDFFVEPSAESFPFEYPEDISDDLKIYRTPEPAGPLLKGFLDARRPLAYQHGQFRRRAECAGAARDRLHHPHGNRRHVAGGDAGRRQGLVPRFELAAGAGAAQSRHRRALRLGLPDPAQARPRGARRPGGNGGRFHRPARLVRGLYSGRRLDRPRPDVGPAHRRKPCAAGRDAAFPQRSAHLRHGELRQCRVRLRDARRSRRRASAHHQAVLGRSPGTRSTRWATRSMRCCKRKTCA